MASSWERFGGRGDQNRSRRNSAVSAMSVSPASSVHSDDPRHSVAISDIDLTPVGTRPPEHSWEAPHHEHHSQQQPIAAQSYGGAPPHSLTWPQQQQQQHQRPLPPTPHRDFSRQGVVLGGHWMDQPPAPPHAHHPRPEVEAQRNRNVSRHRRDEQPLQAPPQAPSSHAPSSAEASGTSSSSRLLLRGLRERTSRMFRRSESVASTEEQRAANNPYNAGTRDRSLSRSRFFSSRVFGRDSSPTAPAIPPIPAQHQQHPRMRAENFSEVPLPPESWDPALAPPPAPWAAEEVRPRSRSGSLTHAGNNVVTPEGRPLRRVDSNDEFYRRRMEEARQQEQDRHMTHGMLLSAGSSWIDDERQRRVRHEQHEREQEALNKVIRKR